jgi:hypothetical protein
MFEQGSLSTSERIATLRQYFRSRRADNPLADARVEGAYAAGSGTGLESTSWPETQWSDTQFDPATAENC